MKLYSVKFNSIYNGSFLTTEIQYVVAEDILKAIGAVNVGDPTDILEVTLISDCIINANAQTKASE